MKILTLLILLAFPQFPVFRHLRTEDGLSQNTILAIVQDADHNMWFATMDAVDKYDGYHFSTYEIDCTKLFTDSKGRVCVLSEGVSRYEKTADRFVSVPGEEERMIRDSLSRQKHYQDSLLLSRWNGEVGIISEMAVSDDMLWFATTDGGVIGIENYGRGRTVQWTMSTEGRPICSNNVRSICYDGQGHIWAGTGNGLSVIDTKDYSVVNLRQSPEHPEGLGNNMVKDIFLDDAGGVWIGSFYGGVDYYRTKQVEFLTVKTGMDSEVIGDIAEDADRRLWIGTGRSGMCRLDPESGDVSRINVYGDRPEYDDVKSIVFAMDGRRVYVGTGLGGVVVMDYATGRVISYPGESCPKAVYSILEEDDRYLWLGTMVGLFLYDTYSGSSSKVDINPRSIFTMKRHTRDGTVLIGSATSLISCRMAVVGGVPEVTEIRNYEGISAVQDILLLKNEIWVATRRGLYRIGESGKARKIDGLSSSLVRGLECDGQGNVWAGTDNGLYVVSPEDGRVARFYKSDGLATNFFSIYAHTVTSDGRMYFGGVGGLVSFRPQNLTVDKLSRTPAVSSVLVDGKALRNWSDGVVLHSGQKVLDIYFSVPNYSSSQRDVFHYRLKGSSDNWAAAGPSAQVSFSSLKPGRYVFELASENAYGIPCENIYSMPVEVRPPWYFSVVAVSWYLIMLVLSVTLLIRILVQKVARDKDREIVRLRTLSLEEIRKMRVRQYAGVNLSAGDEAFLMQVLQRVEENMGKADFGVETLASMLCTTRGNLHTKMKRITGDSVIRFIQKVRFEKACELLRSTDKTIAEVGEELGFSSPAYFTAGFKRFTGVLPGEYRRENNHTKS